MRSLHFMMYILVYVSRHLTTIEVPLTFLMNPANHERHSRNFQGETRHFYAMPYKEYYIWGATAGMLINLYQILTNP